MRRRTTAEPCPVPPLPILPALDLSPTAIYRPEQIRAALGLRASSLRTEWRRGRLRIVRRCGRNYIFGKDLLTWLDAAELVSPAKRKEASCV